MNSSIRILALSLAAAVAPSWTAAQTLTPPPAPAEVKTAAVEEQAEERPVSWKKLLPNIGADQKRIWTFPLKLGQKKYLVPTAIIIGATAGLVALDPKEGRYFRRTDRFEGFNNVFTSNATSVGMLAAPLSLYGLGLIRHDSKMSKTALLIGQAIADTEIVTTVMKDIDRRKRPAAISPNGDFGDTWFNSEGSFVRGRGSMPSGHTVVAFSIATVISRRYGNHRWVPYVAYGMAGLVGFSRMTRSSHFMSDVFVGGALGYSIGRFTVLRQ